MVMLLYHPEIGALGLLFTPLPEQFWFDNLDPQPSLPTTTTIRTIADFDRNTVVRLCTVNF